MAITLSTNARNVKVNACLGLLDAGAGTNPVFIIKTAGSVVLGQVPMNSTKAFGDAVAGVATANSLPLEDPSADTNGQAAIFDAVDKDGTVVFSGTVSAIGGSGDLQMANTSVVQGQPIRITGATYTQPAS